MSEGKYLLPKRKITPFQFGQKNLNPEKIIRQLYDFCVISNGKPLQKCKSSIQEIHGFLLYKYFASSQCHRKVMTCQGIATNATRCSPVKQHR